MINEGIAVIVYPGSLLLLKKALPDPVRSGKFTHF